MKPQEFISSIAQAAINSAIKTNIPASFTVADCALESGWGKDCPGFNIFGVKADKSWKGEVSTVNTREETTGGRIYTVTDSFRKYSSWQESLDDHAKFLMSNPRYKDAFKCKTGVAFAAAVAMAGYATDHEYADKIISIIRQYDLQKLDV